MCSIFNYGLESVDHGFSTNSEIVGVLPLVSMQFLGRMKKMQPLWELFFSQNKYPSINCIKRVITVLGNKSLWMGRKRSR